MPLRKLSPDVLFFLALIPLAVALYAPTLGVFFSLDDFEFLLRAAGHESWSETWRRPISTRLFFQSAWALFGETAEFYHLVQWALHLASSWMILLLARRLNLSPQGGRVAVVFFFATPVAFTSLHWISGVQDLSMTFFALLSAWLALSRGRVTALAALLSFALALLCKESAVLLLPAIALLLPMDKERRFTLGIGGALIALLVLFASGALDPKPAGDPYETGYGLNLLWNLLTYLAWSIRLWDYFPDRVAQYQQALVLWGLISPAILSLAYWRLPATRSHILRAALLFLLLLLPVLPLLRHSYYYYLYLPLIPIWFLAGEGLVRFALGRRWIFISVLSLFALGTAWLGSERRHAELGGGLLEDPMMRYAQMAENAVESAGKSDKLPSGDMLILVPFRGDTQDLGGNLRNVEGGRRVQFLPVDRALLAGKALRLFFPKVASAQFSYDFPPGDKWLRQEIWWTFGQGNLAPLGYGEQGRHVLARLLFEKGEPARAADEIRALLALHPGDGNLLYDLGRLELGAGNFAAAEDVLASLETLASQDGAGPSLKRALADLKELYVATQSREP